MNTTGAVMNKVSAREVALKALYKIEQERAFAEETVDALCSGQKLLPADRRLTGELVFGSTKMRKRIDYVLDYLIEDGLERVTPWIRNILRMGIYQLEFTDKIPEYAAVNEAVALAKKFGHEGVARLVNAVLRNYSRKKDQIKFPDNEVEYIAVFYSFPEWLIEKWLNYFGQESVIRLCEYLNRKPSFGFRVNALKSCPEEIESFLTEKGIKFRKGEYAEDYYYLESPIELAELSFLKEGKIYIQDESSLLAARLLDPKPDETIIDLCAAPGGKSTYMAQLMQNKGKILAVDKTANKLEKLKENSCRLGAEIIDFVTADGTSFWTDPADKILIDAPCSGTGVLNRNADARWQKSQKDLARLAEIQLALLENAAKLLKPGGALVYSTCSIMPEENQEVIEKFLRVHPRFVVVDAKPFVSAALITQSGHLRSLPFLHKIDGAFAVRLDKR